MKIIIILLMVLLLAGSIAVVAATEGKSGDAPGQQGQPGIGSSSPPGQTDGGNYGGGTVDAPGQEPGKRRAGR
jgi:uncharacterized protein YceK